LERDYGLLFLSSTDREVGAFGTWDGTGDKDDTVFLAHGDDFEILDGRFGGSHVTWHFLVFPNATRSGAATNRTGSTVHHVTVGHWLATEAVALDGALETATDGIADHIDILAGLKGGESWVLGRNLSPGFKAEFLNAAFWSGTGFFEASEVWLVDAEFFLVVETNLDGGVTVGFRSFGLEDGVAFNVDDGNRNAGACFFIKDAGHAEFFADKSE
jgi:hypothetical protein